MITFPVMSVIYILSYCVAELNEGAITIVSLTDQPEASSTVIWKSPGRADFVKRVIVLLGPEP